MTENNIDGLRKARYMSLSCPPASPEAMGQVEDIGVMGRQVFQFTTVLLYENQTPN